MKHVVGFSGGIDSQATALWVRERFPAEDIYLMNSDAGGNEHPMTTEFIHHYSATVFPVICLSPIIADMTNRAVKKRAALGYAETDPLTFDVLAELKGRFPSRKAQFCTHHLKLEPQRRWMAEVFPVEPGETRAGIVERYAGVRRDESRDRANVLDREWDDLFLCWLNRPVAAWTKPECFEYVQSRGEAINPLYTLGFDRVGCAPCVNAGKDDIRMWAARFPEMIDKVRAWETRVGRSFFPCCMPKNGGPNDGKKGRWGWIDEVVEWSKTVHGGDQYALPILEGEVMSGVCMSNYGLCE